jgi:FtsZ-interacting cell division protein ZipA
MPWWAWILVVIGAVVLVAAVVAFFTRSARERRLREDREKASELRQEAEDRYAEAGKREAAAEQEALRARREREAADDAMRQAEHVDPDVEDDTDENEADAASETRPADRG